MAQYMRDLPGVPDFPVYGLSPAWTGLRWLTQWNGPDRLWTVSLGHGELDSDDTAVVHTTVKQPSPFRQDEGDDRAFALGDAVLGAVRFLSEPLGSFKVQNKFVGDEGYDPEITLDLLGPAWVKGVVIVDGQTYAARTRIVGHRWALVSDLPLTAVAITCGRDAEVLQWNLVDVRRMLDEYV